MMYAVLTWGKAAFPCVFFLCQIYLFWKQRRHRNRPRGD
jgi:cbb3-type cytochrome oxidase subunit 3